MRYNDDEHETVEEDEEISTEINDSSFVYMDMVRKEERKLFDIVMCYFVPSLLHPSVSAGVGYCAVLERRFPYHFIIAD